MILRVRKLRHRYFLLRISYFSERLRRLHKKDIALFLRSRKLLLRKLLNRRFPWVQWQRWGEFGRAHGAPRRSACSSTGKPSSGWASSIRSVRSARSAPAWSKSSRRPRTPRPSCCNRMQPGARIAPANTHRWRSRSTGSGYGAAIRSRRPRAVHGFRSPSSVCRAAACRRGSTSTCAPVTSCASVPQPVTSCCPQRHRTSCCF